MNGVAIHNKSVPNRISSLQRTGIRNEILNFETDMMNAKGVEFGDNENCPLTHSFSDGMYVREIAIPKGRLIVGKIHKHDHPNFLLKGEVTVVTESEGRKRIKAPCSMISTAGTKRIVYTHEDTVWATVHSNPDNYTDLSKLEEIVIAKNYDEFEKYIGEEKSKKYLKPPTPSNNMQNCGLEALKNFSDLKNISIKTLIQLSQDNDLKLYAYKIAVKELKNISLPAIVHSKDHFSYISDIDQLDSKLKYTGYVLLTKKSNYPIIKVSKQAKIIGATWIAVIGSATTLTVAGIGYAKQQSAIKATQTSPCESNCKDTCKAQHGAFFSGRQKCIKECNANCAVQANQPPPPAQTSINWWYVSAGVLFVAAVLVWIFRKRIFKIG